MTLTIGEVIDRLCIEMQKEFFFGAEGTKVDECLKELSHRDPTERHYEVAMLKAVVKLALANATIWANEWGIRSGKDASLEETGRRARLIRRVNDEGRCAAKRELDELFGDAPEKRCHGYNEDSPVPEPQYEDGQ